MSKVGGGCGLAGASRVSDRLYGRLSDERLDVTGGALSCGGTGAYSRTVPGLDWGRFSDDGRRVRTIAKASASSSSGGYARVHERRAEATAHWKR